MVLAKPDSTFKDGQDSFLILVDGIGVTEQIGTNEFPVKMPKELIEWAVKEFKDYLPPQD